MAGVSPTSCHLRGVGAITAEKVKYELLKLPFPCSFTLPKIENKKTHLILGDVTEVNDTINNLKDEGVEVPSISPFNSPI